jgi:hypothetical protein
LEFSFFYKFAGSYHQCKICLSLESSSLGAEVQLGGRLPGIPEALGLTSALKKEKGGGS